MLLLLFHVGENLYAIDTSPIVEIVPMVLLRKILPAPDYLAGVFNYHGEIVPAIDLCHLIQGRTCHICFSTRIIIVNYVVNYQTSDQTSRRLGLIAERVTETLKTSANQVEPTERMSTVPYLGDVFLDETRMIQQIYWEYLIADVHQTSLSAGGSIQTNGTGSN
jgi:chemotaxis-related protein WspB